MPRRRQVVNPSERVTPYQAMQSVTINAAKQHREGKTKGSLVVGKLADLVILSRNPVKVPPLDIDKIAVVQTIKEGKVGLSGLRQSFVLLSPLSGCRLLSAGCCCRLSLLPMAAWLAGQVVYTAPVSPPKAAAVSANTDDGFTHPAPKSASDKLTPEQAAALASLLGAKPQN